MSTLPAETKEHAEANQASLAPPVTELPPQSAPVYYVVPVSTLVEQNTWQAYRIRDLAMENKQLSERLHVQAETIQTQRTAIETINRDFPELGTGPQDSTLLNITRERNSYLEMVQKLESELHICRAYLSSAQQTIVQKDQLLQQYSMTISALQQEKQSLQEDGIFKDSIIEQLCIKRYGSPEAEGSVETETSASTEMSEESGWSQHEQSIMRSLDLDSDPGSHETDVSRTYLPMSRESSAIANNSSAATPRPVATRQALKH